EGRVAWKGQEGIRAHTRVEELEPRRTLHAYGLARGERHFGVAMQSVRLGLGGRIDMAIALPDETIPVEWKNSEGPLGLNHKYQLTPYAPLAEDHFRPPLRRAFLDCIPPPPDGPGPPPPPRPCPPIPGESSPTSAAPSLASGCPRARACSAAAASASS